MRHPFTAARLLTLMLLVVVAFTGCGKDKAAETRLTKAQSSYETLQRLDGAKHDYAGMQRLQNLIDQGNQQRAAGNAEQALTLAKEAVALVDELEPRVRSA